MSTASVAGKLPTANEKKYLKTKEWVFYLLAMFFLFHDGHGQFLSPCLSGRCTAAFK